MAKNNSVKLPDRQPTLRVKTAPNDANQSGDIFGGWLMAHVDVAGAIEASKRAQGKVVTVAVEQLTLLKPLFVYDIVSFYTRVKKVGTTSVTIEIQTYAQRAPLGEEVIKVSDATLVYVAVEVPGIKRVIPK